MKTRIKELRESKHLTQNALAIALNCSQNYISQIELEHTVPRADVLIATAKYFNTSVDYLLCLSDQRYKMESNVSGAHYRSLEYMQKLHQLSKEEAKVVYSLIDVLCDASEQK